MTETSLQLPGSVHVRASTEELFEDLGAVLSVAAARAIQQRGVFHLALSGGSTPEPFYMRLVTDPRFRMLPWQVTHVWQVDERRVPPEDAKSNFRMLRESLLDHVTIKNRQVHAMPVMEADPATLYENELREHLPVNSAAGGGAAGQLDFVLLGMGDDAHTASLFPGSPALQEQKRWVTVNEGPKVTPPARVTLTFPLLNAARQLAVLVVGAKKLATLRRVVGARGRGIAAVEELPITGIQPRVVSAEAPALQWFLDADAAGHEPVDQRIELPP